MKKSAYPAALLLVAAGLSGCPLYEHDDDGCYRDSDCASGYWCDDRDGICHPDDSESCRRPSDCGTNETCSRFGTCTPGDCHYSSVGCVSGYECSSASGRWECVAEGNEPQGGAGGSTNEAGGAGGAIVAAAGEGGGGATNPPVVGAGAGGEAGSAVVSGGSPAGGGSSDAAGGAF